MFRPGFPPARALPPIRFPSVPRPARILFRDLLLPVPIVQDESANGSILLSRPNGGLHCSALPAPHDRLAPRPPFPVRKALPTSGSEAGDRFFFPLWECTNPVWIRVPLLRVTQSAGLARGYEYCSEWIAQSLEPPPDLRGGGGFSGPSSALP